MNDNTYLIKKEQCPRCAKNGNDKSRDNLATYSDGHSYCFSCGFIKLPTGIEKFRKKKDEVILPEDKTIWLPFDSDIFYPEKALAWVGQYGLTRNDLLIHRVLWSESKQRLIFAVFSESGVIAWQGRSFEPTKDNPKWFGVGNLKDTFNILGTGDTLVLTEDVVSAIKVSKCGVRSMPLYGSFVGVERFKRLYKLLDKEDKVLVWLDPDKRLESVKEAKLGMLYGVNSFSIFSERDPKEHSYEEIKEIVNEIK